MARVLSGVPHRPDSLGARIGAALTPGDPPRAVLVGFPCDTGVRRNGGRPGAASAPDAIRQALHSMLPDPAIYDVHAALLEHTLDVGDLPTTGDLAHDQLRLGRLLQPHIEAGAFVVVLGGGHETTYGHFLAYANEQRPVSLLNWDAHPDVRDLVDDQGHSGSPFRQALLHPSQVAGSYTVAGLQPYVVSRDHLEFIAAHGGTWIWRQTLTLDRVAALYDAIPPAVAALVSFDLDAVDQSSAPGVSAPTVDGLTAEVWLHAAFLAGRTPAVTSIDVVEVNPRFDVDGQTARLAALTVWHALRGRALAAVRTRNYRSPTTIGRNS
jgi:formiminoglutamase